MSEEQLEDLPIDRVIARAEEARQDLEDMEKSPPNVSPKSLLLDFLIPILRIFLDLLLRMAYDQYSDEIEEEEEGGVYPQYISIPSSLWADQMAYFESLAQDVDLGDSDHANITRRKAFHFLITNKSFVDAIDEEEAIASFFKANAPISQVDPDQDPGMLPPVSQVDPDQDPGSDPEEHYPPEVEDVRGLARDQANARLNLERKKREQEGG